MISFGYKLALLARPAASGLRGSRILPYGMHNFPDMERKSISEVRVFARGRVRRTRSI